jgi:hypothetical protein
MSLRFKNQYTYFVRLIRTLVSYNIAKLHHSPTTYSSYTTLHPNCTLHPTKLATPYPENQLGPSLRLSYTACDFLSTLFQRWKPEPRAKETKLNCLLPELKLRTAAPAPATAPTPAPFYLPKTWRKKLYRKKIMVAKEGFCKLLQL